MTEGRRSAPTDVTMHTELPAAKGKRDRGTVLCLYCIHVYYTKYTCAHNADTNSMPLLREKSLIPFKGGFRCYYLKQRLTFVMINTRRNIIVLDCEQSEAVIGLALDRINSGAHKIVGAVLVGWKNLRKKNSAEQK